MEKDRIILSQHYNFYKKPYYLNNTIQLDEQPYYLQKNKLIRFDTIHRFVTKVIRFYTDFNENTFCNPELTLINTFTMENNSFSIMITGRLSYDRVYGSDQ